MTDNELEHFKMIEERIFKWLADIKMDQTKYINNIFDLQRSLKLALEREKEYESIKR